MSVVRCLYDAQCEAYQHTGSPPGNCILIYKNSTVEDGQTFLPAEQTAVYSKDSLLLSQIKLSVLTQA